MKYTFLALAIILIASTLAVAYTSLQKSSFEKDMQLTYEAMEAQDWVLAEHLLQSILSTNLDHEERWDLWLHLLEVKYDQDPYSAGMIAYLETMLIEFNNKPFYVSIILARLSKTYIAVHQYEHANSILEKLIELPHISHEERAKAYQDIAQVNIALKRYAVAADALQTCLNTASSLSSESLALCQYDLANVYYIQGQHEKAIPLSQEIFDNTNLSDDLRGRAGFIIGDSLHEQGKTKEALLMFEKIQNYYPNEMVIEKHIEILKSDNPISPQLEKLVKPIK